MKRRRLLKGIIGTSVLAGGAAWWANRHWDGLLINPCMTGLPNNFERSDLWQQVWQGLAPEEVWDCHVHTVGLGDSGSGVWVNPDMQSWLHPMQHLQYQFYMNAGCISDPNAVDQDYWQRLVSLVNSMPIGFKVMLLAFDYHRDTNGTALKEYTTFYVPNDYPAKLAKQFPERFEWVASVHPYRKNALDELERVKALGAVAVKWLPPAQNMDPMDRRCDTFYQKMQQLELPLICHAGTEKAVKGSDTQELGNPLRLRRALDQGVKVVVAHCASLGENQDLDLPSKPMTSSFELFSRLMNENHSNLYGELSAILQINRKPVVLRSLLERTDWHDRLVNGSDYPLPAVMPLIALKDLNRAGLLHKRWNNDLNQLRQHNGLLFDFAVKRLLEHNGQRFPEKVFETRTVFDMSS